MDIRAFKALFLKIVGVIYGREDKAAFSLSLLSHPLIGGRINLDNTLVEELP